MEPTATLKCLAGLEPARGEGCGAPTDRTPFVSGRPFGAPRGPASAASSLIESSAGPRTVPAEIDPGFPTEAEDPDGSRRCVTPAAPAETTLYQARLQVARAVLLERRSPLRMTRTVLGTHPSWSRDGPSLTEVWRAGISRRYPRFQSNFVTPGLVPGAQ
jgi:hypothetical protein